MFKRETFNRLCFVINNYKLRLQPNINYTESSSFGKFELLPIGNIRFNDILKYRTEFESYLGRDISIDFEAGKVVIVVPKPKPDTIMLTDVLSKQEFKRCEGLLKIALGEDEDGDLIIGDMDKWQRVLIGGKPGGGKSTTIHSMICSLIIQADTDELKLILFDFKGNEFNVYERLRHLYAPITYDLRNAVNTLKTLIKEMRRRYELLSNSGSRDFLSHLEKTNESLPRIILIIDEFHILTRDEKYGKIAEQLLIDLASLSRASGIYLILSTQTPNSEVISSLIKRSFPIRIAFKVEGWQGSQVILDENGAEKLKGNGHMILKDDEGVYQLFGSYIGEEETKQFVQRFNGIEEMIVIDDEVDVEIIEVIDPLEIELEPFEYFESASRFVIETGLANKTQIQSHLKKGWKVVEQAIRDMMWFKIIGKTKEGRDYPVLISLEDFESDLNNIKEEYNGL